MAHRMCRQRRLTHPPGRGDVMALPPNPPPPGISGPHHPPGQHPRSRERRPDVALILEEGFGGCMGEGCPSPQHVLREPITGVRGHANIPKQLSPLPPSQEQAQDSDNKNCVGLGMMQAPCNSGTRLVSSLSHRQGPQDEKRGVTCPASNSKTELGLDPGSGCS